MRHMDEVLRVLETVEALTGASCQRRARGLGQQAWQLHWPSGAARPIIIRISKWYCDRQVWWLNVGIEQLRHLSQQNGYLLLHLQGRDCDWFNSSDLVIPGTEVHGWCEAHMLPICYENSEPQAKFNIPWDGADYRLGELGGPYLTHFENAFWQLQE